jgi:hypothetical protein
MNKTVVAGKEKRKRSLKQNGTVRSVRWIALGNRCVMKRRKIAAVTANSIPLTGDIGIEGKANHELKIRNSQTAIVVSTWATTTSSRGSRA